MEFAALVSLLLTVSLSGASAEFEISVVTPETVFLGSEAVLECTFIVDNLPVNLQYLAIIWTFKGKDLLKFGNGLKVLEPRASISETEIMNGNASLTLSKVTTADEGKYTCSIIYSPEKRLKHITLNVQAPPEIILTQQEVIKWRENLLRCSVIGFFPKEIDVYWMKNGKVLPGSSTSKPQSYANGTYMINSTLPMTPSDSDTSLNFSCCVHHVSLVQILKEDVMLLLKEERKELNEVSLAAIVVPLLVIVVVMAVAGLFVYRKLTFKELSVCEIQGPKTWTLGETVELSCVGHHCPKGTKVEWIKRHMGKSKYISANASSEQQDKMPLLNRESYSAKISESSEGRDYLTITSTLLFTPTLERDEGASFSCSFIINDLQKEPQNEFKDFILQGKPQAMGSIQCVSVDEENVRCSLDLHQFYPEEISINWSCGTDNLEDIEEHEEHMAENEIHQPIKIQTMCTVPEGDFVDQNFKICVTWKHISQEEPGYKDISVTHSDFPGRPALDDIIVPRLIHGEEASLKCRVSGYFPKRLQFQWLKLEEGSDGPVSLSDSQGHYKFDYRAHHHEAEKGHSCTATLIFSPDQHRDQGSEYLCSVSHPSLQESLQKSTGKLTVLAVPRLRDLKITPLKDLTILTLDVASFYPQVITITWGSDLPGKSGALPSKGEPERSNGAYRIRSSCALTDFMIRKIGAACINVSIDHESLTTPLKVTMQIIRNGSQWDLQNLTPGWQMQETH